MLGLSLLGLGGPLATGVTTSSVPGYALRHYNTDDGLPGNNVTSMVQTRDGYLWVGTRNGLVRFDGVRFTVFDSSNTPEIRAPHVSSLFEDAAGTLWIGYLTGEILSYRAGVFHREVVEANWGGGKIFGFGHDPGGSLWVINQAGELVRLRDNLFIPAATERITWLLTLTRETGGRSWLHRENDVLKLEDGYLRPEILDIVPTNRYIQGISASRDGGLWVVNARRLQKWKNGKWDLDLGLVPWGDTPIPLLLELGDGRLAAGTADDGLYLSSTSRQEFLHLCRTNGFPDDWVTGLCEDRERNLWVTLGNGGLVMLRPANVATVSPPDHWQGRAVLSVSRGPDDALWIGTEGAGLYRFQNGSWTNFGLPVGLPHRYLWSVALDTHGQVWAGSWGFGVFVQTDGQFETPKALKELLVPTVALLPQTNGAMLVGSALGLYKYDAGRVTWLARKPQITADVCAIREGLDGAIWFGMSGGGLGCWKDGALRQYRRADGLANDFVQCLHFERDGTMWIGTFGGGLNRFKDGRFVAMTKAQGLPSDVICDLQDDGQGFYWISTHGGIARVSSAELKACADGELKQINCLTYGTSDGLPSLQCSGGFQPASCRTSDGRLWFPNSKGLVAVDPGSVASNPLPPPVMIERLLVDDQLLVQSPLVPAEIEIGPGRHRFEFQFSGLSFSAPEKVRFKYRLAGLERDWVETTSPRRAYYSYVPPGNYRFEVMAANNDGVWSAGTASLAFTVLPWFWQTWWFRISGAVLTAAGGGGVVWLGARRRLRRKLELIERQQAIERERARIAKDIHDDLGAGLTRISLLSESLAPDDASTTQVAGVLNRIFATTREMTQTMDEIVWAVNPQHDTLDSLAGYLGSFTQDFLSGTGVRCRLDVPLQLPGWRLEAEVRHNLFLAVKEALNNALRHAQATEIRVSLTVGEAGFVVVVEDNGRGIPGYVANNGAGHAAHRNGLKNMRQRLAQIGGRCEITGDQGRGTRVEFQVVLKPALR